MLRSYKVLLKEPNNLQIYKKLNKQTQPSTTSSSHLALHRFKMADSQFNKHRGQPNSKIQHQVMNHAQVTSKI